MHADLEKSKVTKTPFDALRLEEPESEELCLPVKDRRSVYAPEAQAKTAMQQQPARLAPSPKQKQREEEDEGAASVRFSKDRRRKDDEDCASLCSVHSGVNSPRPATPDDYMTFGAQTSIEIFGCTTGSPTTHDPIVMSRNIKNNDGRRTQSKLLMEFAGGTRPTSPRPTSPASQKRIGAVAHTKSTLDTCDSTLSFEQNLLSFYGKKTPTTAKTSTSRSTCGCECGVSSPLRRLEAVSTKSPTHRASGE